MAATVPPEVRLLRADELAGCLPLSQEAFGFAEVDQIPPWTMHTTNTYGGLTIGAFAGAQLVGYSYAMPGFDGRPFLLSCGLAVREAHRGQGIGEALKRVQAREARRLGYALIRWTTGSLSHGPLFLYLSKLGARLVGLRERFYDEVRPVRSCDEVEIEWDLLGKQQTPGERPAERVELPRCVPADEAESSVLRVRGEMTSLLAEGFVGTAVERGRRTCVVFERAAGE